MPSGVNRKDARLASCDRESDGQGDEDFVGVGRCPEEE